MAVAGYEGFDVGFERHGFVLLGVIAVESGGDDWQEIGWREGRADIFIHAIGLNDADVYVIVGDL